MNGLDNLQIRAKDVLSICMQSLSITVEQNGCMQWWRIVDLLACTG